MESHVIIFLIIDAVVLLILIAGGIMAYGRQNAQVADLRVEVSALRKWKEEHQQMSSVIQSQLSEITTLLRVICGKLDIPMRDD